MKKEVLLSTIVISLVISVVLIVQVGAEPGKLDPTFGDEGVTLFDFGGLDDWPNAAALQNDGKILVSGWVNIWPGDFGTVRVLADGRPDSSFGSDGKVTTAFSDNPDNVDAAWSVTAGPDGRIYVSGETCDADYFICDVATAVYKEDGSLDETFAGDGKTAVSPGTDTVYAWPHRDILQDDGKLIAGGVAYNEGETFDILLRRHNPDGALDTTFGTDGFVVQDFDGEHNYVQDLVGMPGGKILVVGGFGEPTEDPFLYDAGIGFMALYKSDGALDTAFGDGAGLVTWDYKGSKIINKSVHYGSDGLIYILGEAEGDCTLRRFNSVGEADATFGTEGWALVDTDTDDACWDLRETPDHKLVFNGAAYPTESTMQLQSARRHTVGRRGLSLNAMQGADVVMTMIGRYKLDGSPDETFGPDGLVLTQVYPSGSVAYGLAVQPDGKIITASEVPNLEEGLADLGVIRFLGDGPAAQVFAPSVMAP